MCQDLFNYFLGTGGPEQKTIIFCVRDTHADEVAAALNTLYAQWCAAQGKSRLEPFAFKCTAASVGGQYLADLRGASRSHFIATTVELLSTGVDVPCVRNIVFFKYVRSPIAFYQMVGRGTRIDPATGKLMFRIYDYTNATRLFGEEFVGPVRKPREREVPPEPPPQPPIRVEGFEVHVTPAGRYILLDGMPVTIEEYKERLAAKLVEEAPTLEQFRTHWINPPERKELLGRLPEAGRSVLLVRQLEDMAAFDLYDVLAELGYGLAPRTRTERAEAFTYKHEDWLASLSPATTATLKAMVAQFAQSGTDSLESPYIFQIPDVVQAGGLVALKVLGQPAEVLRKTKERIFAA
jgi:type I restriction enzyme R subunit